MALGAIVSYLESAGDLAASPDIVDVTLATLSIASMNVSRISTDLCL